MRTLVFMILICAAVTFARADRLTDLQQRVAALSHESPIDRQKQAVLNIAMERARASLDAGDSAYAQDLLGDVEAALRIDAATLLASNPQAGHISMLLPLRSTQNNPYLVKLTADARDQLAKTDVAFAKATSKQPTFTDLGGPSGSRTAGNQIEDYFWLFAHPSSPMKGDAELLARLLRRANAYIDALDLNGRRNDAASQSSANRSDIYDDFALGPASTVLRELNELYPHIFLPSQKKQLDRAMHNAASTLWARAKDRPGEYSNIDVSIACEMLNVGLYTHSQEMIDKSRFLIDAQESHLLPDGGFKYIWSQNESASYHNTVTDYLTRYYEISGYEKATDLLRRSQWYGPIMGRLIEFWTVPSWKGMWNTASGSFPGGESVATLSGNPYVRTVLDHNLKVGRFDARRNIAWYTNEIKPAPLPDNYIAPDRNTVGPRAWFGRFTYAATLRDIVDTEPGHATIMGAMITEPNYSLQSVLFGVYPRVRIAEKALTAEGAIDPRSHAWITAKLHGSSVYARQSASVAATYKLHVFGSSQKGREVDWYATQVWIALPDRIVGSLSIFPGEKGAEAFEVNGVVRFGTGGTGFGRPQDPKSPAENHWSLGDLHILLHHNDFASAEVKKVAFRVPKAPAFELTLGDAAETNGNTKRKFPAGKTWNYIVEIRPSWANGDARVERLKCDNGLIALKVQAGAQSYVACFNPTTSELALEPALVKNMTGYSMHRADGPVERVTADAISVPAYAQRLFVQSAEPADHQAGFESFEKMLQQPVNQVQH